MAWSSGIIERRVVTISGSERGDCKGFLVPSLWEIAKGNSSELLVACGSSFVLVVWHPSVGLGV